jgi:hypothetical protein
MCLVWPAVMCCAVQQVTLLTAGLSGSTREQGLQCPLMVTQDQVCVQGRGFGQHLPAPSSEQCSQGSHSACAGAVHGSMRLELSSQECFGLTLPCCVLRWLQAP